MEKPKEMFFLMRQVYATIFSLINKIQVKGDKYIKKMTSRQLMTMIAIAHLPENKSSFNSIARKLGTTKQSIKQIVRILEKKGYIVTLQSDKDKRAVNVEITKNGKKAALECSERGMYFFLDLFHEFSKEEMKILWKLLKKLYRFDGEKQDGFEEEVNVAEPGEAQMRAQERVFNEFSKKRNKPKTQGDGMISRFEKRSSRA